MHPDATLLARVSQQLRGWAGASGFSQIGVADVDLSGAEPGLLAWLQAGFHGQMHYMAAHGLKRARPAELVPGTVRVLSVRADYLPRDTPPDWRERERARLRRPGEAVVSVYARGRDYHKVVRQRLQQLAERIAAEIGPHGHRVFCDSAPVLEVELASRAAIGWRGKHTLLLDRDHGSMFFLGEIYVDLPLPLTLPPTLPHTLPADAPMPGTPDQHGIAAVQGACGRCRACLDACPTGAIVAPGRLDARRCISYLTIEHDGPIPVELRAPMGNRIYGCDDCQLVCPWNKYARASTLPDFDVRPPFVAPTLLALWAWDEPTFLRLTEGSAIRRIGHARWRRNLAIALGNAWRETGDPAIATALQSALDPTPSDPVLAEHLGWALAKRA